MKKDKELTNLLTSSESSTMEDKHKIEFLEQQLDEAQTARDDLAANFEQAQSEKNNLESELKKIEHTNDYLQAELENKVELLKTKEEKIDTLEKTSVEMKEPCYVLSLNWNFKPWKCP